MGGHAKYLKYDSCVVNLDLKSLKLMDQLYDIYSLSYYSIKLNYIFQQNYCSSYTN
jgi:hypothetical protein